MLRKNPHFLINPANPFQEDKLKRLSSAENLTTLIRTITQPFVLSINSPWGTGKTTFVKMWEAKLLKEGNPCLYFNAWESDFSDDPLISFIGEIESHIEKGNLNLTKKTKSSAYFKKIKKVGGQILRKTTPLGLKLLTSGLINNVDELKQLTNLTSDADKNIAEFIEKITEEKIKSYKAEKNAIEEFRKNLNGFIEVMMSEHETLKPPLVFFVDELDRCRPTYAIALLERIKHLFNVKGIVFVLSLDKEQVKHSIRALYGVGMDADGYLRRFVDLDFQLPKPDHEGFCYYLAEKFNLEEVFKKRPDGRNEKEQLLSVFIEMSKIFDLSLRVQEQCFTQFNVVLRTTQPHYSIHPRLLSFFVALKAANTDLYQKYCNQQIGYQEIFNFIGKTKAGEKLINDKLGVLIEAYLKCGFLKRNEFDKLYLDVRETHKKAVESNQSSTDTERLQMLKKILDNFEDKDTYGTFPYLANKIEISESFNQT